MPSKKKSSNGAGGLVVVESPAKARTLGKILDGKFTVKASMGHIRDLPKSKLGIETDDGFKPLYEVMKDKAHVVHELKAAGQSASEIYLATDPDREGEAIAWHLLYAAGWTKRPVQRVAFHEITKDAVMEAFRHPRAIDTHLVDAQQARRVLDRLVGYQLSPLLWRKVQRGLSAGRVQSVAVRLVVEREKEILAFVPREYWRIEATLHKQKGTPEERTPFVAVLWAIKGKRTQMDIPNEKRAKDIVAELENATYRVDDVASKTVHQSPRPPFITSTMQQEASRKLRFTAKRTMMLAQQLYEGIELGSEGSVGLITYMRTDSTHVAPEALRETRGYIHAAFGDDYLPKQPRFYTRKVMGAQEAHEAIRPTSVHRTPDAMKRFLSHDQHRLYELVWQRMVASQMSDAVSDATTAQIEGCGPKCKTPYTFRATGTVLRFPGFLKLYREGADEDEEAAKALPPLEKEEPLDLDKLDPQQKFTQPPSRYTEATLIKALEEKGIGRPSTYAPILSTIQDRGYIMREGARLRPTPLGTTVSDLLTEFFPSIMDLDFTARMEVDLDEIASGQRRWVPVVKEFYEPFTSALEAAKEKMPRVKVEEPTGEKCPECGKDLVLKIGRFGPFIACKGFPECRYTKKALKKTGARCPECGGDLVERRGKKRGRLFFGCANFPTCNFLVNRRPYAEPCPECGGLLINAGRERAECTRCAYKGPAPEREPAEDEPQFVKAGT